MLAYLKLYIRILAIKKDVFLSPLWFKKSK